MSSNASTIPLYPDDAFFSFPHEDVAQYLVSRDVVIASDGTAHH